MMWFVVLTRKGLTRCDAEIDCSREWFLVLKIHGSASGSVLFVCVLVEKKKKKKQTTG